MRANRYISEQEARREWRELHRHVTTPDRLKVSLGFCVLVAVVLFMTVAYGLGYVLRHGFHEKLTPLFR